MAKQKYLKFQVSVSVGNRKSQLVMPIEVEEDQNYHDNELAILIAAFADAVKSLPTAELNYRDEDIIQEICTYFALQPVPTVE